MKMMTMTNVEKNMDKNFGKTSWKKAASVIVKGLIVLILVLFCCGVTALARNHAAREEKQTFYLTQKNLILQDVREYLKGKGYQNSGVTVTRRVSAAEEEEWVLSIHHGGFDDLSDEEKETLKAELEGLATGENREAAIFVKLW